MGLVAPEPGSRRLFTEIAAGPDASVDLAHAALLIACEEYPDLDVPRYLKRFDALATAVAEAATEGRPDPLSGSNPLSQEGPLSAAGPRSGAGRLLLALHRRLFEDEGIRGNADDYYDPRNSYLNDVLDRRTGIPITLSAVYIEVARRAGLKAEGVGLPGHFIVRVALPEGDVLVDPFHGGKLLTEADCHERVDRIFAGKRGLEPGMLAPCNPKQILARMLRNLKAIHVKNDDNPRALAVVDLLLRLDPRSGEDLRDRGLLHAALDCYASAARDLEAYLALVPNTPEAAVLTEKAVQMRQRAARLN